MRIRYESRNYPLSPELTRKSQRVGLLTTPIYGLILGILPGLLCSILFPASLALPLILIFAGIVAGPLLLRAHRRKKFAQFDEEYQKLLRSMKQ